MYTIRHFKEATLCGFMCSVYNNYTVNLLCSRGDNIIKSVEGLYLHQKGLEVYKKKEVKERTEQQYRVESKVVNECLVSRKECLGNKQANRQS